MVKAYTYDSAKAKVEASKNIKVKKGVKTESVWYWIGQSFVTNAGVFMCLVVWIMLLHSWTNLMELVQTLPTEFQTLYTLILLATMILSLRLPTLISGFFERNI